MDGEEVRGGKPSESRAHRHSHPIGRRPVIARIDPASNEVLATVPMPDSGLPRTLK